MRSESAIAPASVVMLLGLWLSAEGLSLPWFEGDKLWPLLIAAAGGCFVLGYLCGGGAWQLFLGLLASGNGLVLYGFTAGAYGWEKLPQLWPLFLVVSGAAGLAYLVASPDAPWPLLVPALGTLLSGTTGLLYGLGLLSLDPIAQLRMLWPALLALTGFLGFIQAIWHGISDR
ncbi:MAG: hypothetical protein HPY83_01405 [Anaerolineae bacterium]|nr:hypothetical protein [Anaerolineae bacterium]